MITCPNDESVALYLDGKARAVATMADSGRVRRPFADEVARVLNEAAAEVRQGFHRKDDV